MTMAILLGGIDLSVGSIIAMSGCLGAGAVVWGGMPEVVGILIGIISGGVFGMFNGFLISKTTIPPFIVTLASQNIAKGIAYVFSQGKPIRCMTDAWKFLGAGYVAGIPTPVITMFIVFFLCCLFLNRTRIGRHVYAVGGNATAAKFSGISTFKVKFTLPVWHHFGMLLNIFSYLIKKFSREFYFCLRTTGNALVGSADRFKHSLGRTATAVTVAEGHNSLICKLLLLISVPRTVDLTGSALRTVG
jgi:ribose transport system permease protein